MKILLNLCIIWEVMAMDLFHYNIKSSGLLLFFINLEILLLLNVTECNNKVL